MSNSNQALKKTVTAMHKALVRDHGIVIPYSALRASYLSAHGLNAHAVGRKGRSAEVEKAPATEWLTRTLYLVEDSAGCLELLALDPSGMYQLHEGFTFPTGRASLVNLYAEVPSVRRYGLPQYLENAPDFFMRHFELETNGAFKSYFKDLGDDSGDTATLEISVTRKEWERILFDALNGESKLSEDVAVWVGQHYGVTFDSCILSSKLDWVSRFLDSLREAEDLLRQPPASKAPKAHPSLKGVDEQFSVKLEWVWPDQDGDHVECSVDLKTGIVTHEGRLPLDLEFSCDVRLVVVAEDEAFEDFFPLVFDAMAEPACWRLKPRRLSELKKFLRENDIYPDVK